MSAISETQECYLAPKVSYSRSFEKIRSSIAPWKHGFSLPKHFYCDSDIYDIDIEAVFFRDWLFVTNECELPRPGDFVTLTVGTAPIVVLRDKDGAIRAFHNTCRHRGSRICAEVRGHAESLVCPYHQWTYGLDGKLLAARYLDRAHDPDEFSLERVHVETVQGLIYICLADVPPDFDRYRNAITPYIAPHDPARTKIVYESTIIEEANWKVVIENNRECDHCAGAHPELLLSLVEMALPDDQRFGEEFEIMEQKAKQWDQLGLPHAPADGGSEFRCIRLPFRKGAVSMTMNGELGCKKLLGNLTEPDLGSVRMFRAPHNWNHFLSDHIIHFRALPLGPDRTEVRTIWLVNEDAIEGWDYDPEELSKVWIATNNQDRTLAEENQRGIRSPAYRPGPYSSVGEFMVIQFAEWYRARLEQFLSDDASRQIPAE